VKVVFDFEEKFLNALQDIKTILEEIKNTMATKAELSAGIVTLQGTATDALNHVTTLLTEQANMIARLEAKIAAGVVDLQPELDQINAVNTAIASAIPNILAAITTAQGTGL